MEEGVMKMDAKRKVVLSETDLIRKGLSKYGRRAYDASLAEGNGAAILRGNNILKITSDGKQTKIASVDKTRSKVTQRKFSLKK